MKTRTNLKAGMNAYQVQEGDTLATVAEKLYGPGLTADNVISLYAYNEPTIGVDPCNLPPGAMIYAPQPPQPTPVPPVPPTPPTPVPPKPHSHKMVGQCTEYWGNGVCLYKECPYPPFQMPC